MPSITVFGIFICAIIAFYSLWAMSVLEASSLQDKFQHQLSKCSMGERPKMGLLRVRQCLRMRALQAIGNGAAFSNATKNVISLHVKAN